MNKDFYTLASVIAKSSNVSPDVQAWLDSFKNKINLDGLESFAEDQNKKPYKFNVWVFACIEAIRRNISSIPKVLYDTKSERVIDKHPILDLFKRPNSDVYGTMLWDQIIVRKLLDGQLFLIPGNGEKIGRGIIPRELYVTANKWVEAKIVDGRIAGWNYKPNGKDIFYEKDGIIRLYNFNPYDDTKGLSVLDVAYISIQLYGKIMSYNSNFFKNGAALSGIIEIDKTLKDDQAKKIQKEFDSQFSGEDKAGKTPVFHGGMKWNQVSSSHKDMMFTDQYNFTKEEILTAFGVPKNQIGDFADQNYSNAVEANRSFWEDTLLPLDFSINQALTYQIIKGINPDYELRSDYSGVEAINDVPKEKIEAFEKLVQNGVPRKEAARVLNIPVNWKNVEVEEKEDEKKKKEENEIAAQQNSTNNDNDNDEDINTENDEKSFRSSLNKFFTDLRNKCLDKIDKDEEANFNVDKEYNSLTETLKTVYIQIIKNFVDISASVNKEVDIQPIEIVRMLNSRSKAFYAVLESINKDISKDKKVVHDLFQNQYGKNKEMAKDEIKALYSQIVRIHA